MAWRLVREVLRQLLSIVARRMAYMVESADAPEAAVADALTYSWAYGEWPSSPTAGTSAFRYHFPPTASSTASCAAPASGQGGPDGDQVCLPLRRAGGKRGGSIARWAAGLEQQWNGQWRLGVENRLVSGSPLVRGPWPGRFRRWRP